MEILFTILILLVFTRIFGAIANYLKQPPLIGELIAGVLLGLIVVKYPDIFPILSEHHHNETFIALTELGIFFLMLLGGIELLPESLIENPKSSFLIGLMGILVPLLFGIALGQFFLPESELKFAQSLFLGTGLSITALPVTVKVLLDLKRLKSKIGKTLISAAFFDDILGLLLLAILIAIIENGSIPEADTLGLIAGKILAFLLISIVIGVFLFNRIAKFFSSFELEELEFSLVLVFALIYSLIAEFFGLHFILGTFMAGLFFRKSTINQKTYNAVKSKVSAVTTGFFGPLFFASIGLQVNFTAFLEIPLFVILLILAAFLGKILGSGLISVFLGFNKKEALGIGFGMSGRGAVELIVADIALKAGLFNKPDHPIIENIFSAVVLMAIVTTLLTPIFLKKTIT